jgi:hypothetical protein
MAPPCYRSDTRELPLDALEAPLLAALRAEAARSALALDGVRVWRTRRENPPATSLLGKLLGRRANPIDPDAEHDMVLVLHATHLLLATHGKQRGTTVTTLPLVQATLSRGVVGAHVATLDAPSDDGITLSGFPGQVGRPGSQFFGLGGPASDACFEALDAAVRRAKGAT